MSIRGQRATLASSALHTQNADFTVGFEGYGRAMQLCIDVTAVAAAGTVTVTIRQVDVVSGKKRDILTSAALATAATWMQIDPDKAPVANLSAQDHVPFYGEVEFNISNGAGDSVTFSAAAYFSP